MIEAENIQAKGRVEIFKLDKSTGERTLAYSKDNLVVTTGLSFIPDRLKTNTIGPLSHIAIGDDDTAVSSSDTALFSEVTRKAIDDLDTTVNVLTTETLFTETEAVFTWKEIGMFNASTGGVMFNRVVINFPKTSLEPVLVRFTITFTNT